MAFYILKKLEIKWNKAIEYMCINVLEYIAIRVNCARIGKMGLFYNCRKMGGLSRCQIYQKQ